MSKMHLRDWVLEYIKNKDLVKKEIVDIKRDAHHVDFLIEYLNRKQLVIVEPSIADLDETLLRINQAKNESEAKYTTLFVLNTKDNLRKVINSWSNAITDPGLSIAFVNPGSTTEKVWVVFPSSHEKVSSKHTLKTLFANVEEADQKKVN